jgi:hypothetical protein
MKKKQKRPLVTRIVRGFMIFLLCVSLIYIGFYVGTGIVYSEFFKDAKTEFRTPGLDDGIVPQGFAYSPEKNVYLQCGYMTDGVSASRIYIVDGKNTSSVRYVNLIASDGSAYLGHTGGITVSGDFVWLANDGDDGDNLVWVLSLSEILSLENGEGVALTKSFKPESRSAFCYADDEYLWVGEFYRGGAYETAENHAFSGVNCEDGIQNAIICAYRLDATKETGIASETPEKILSVTDEVQGFTRTPDGGFILSTSWSISTSKLHFHKNVLEGAADAELEVNGTKVPVWHLDADTLTKQLELPPMSEEVIVKDGRVWVVLESACQKYIFGNLLRSTFTYSYPL